MPALYSFPSTPTIQQFLQQQAKLPYSYQEVGQSLLPEIKGYDNDHHKIYLGKGPLVWQRAKDALTQWEHFPNSWATTSPKPVTLAKGEVVGIFFHLFGLWWMNAAKIVYTLDSDTQFGFAYGTLPSHVEKGEECFWIEIETDGSIFYHINKVCNVTMPPVQNTTVG